MIVLRYIGYTSLAISAILLFIVVVEYELGFIAPSISLAIAGVLFIAFDKMIATLCEIRDLISPKEAIETVAIINEPTKTLAELEAGISTARNKGKL